MKRLHVLLPTLALAGCQQIVPVPSAISPPAMQGHARAQASCGSCHAVDRGATSPHPNAPAFSTIVNQEGVTAATLSTYLRDAHNYPVEMAFQLGSPEVDVLVGYMLTLKDPNYRSPG